MNDLFARVSYLLKLVGIFHIAMLLVFGGSGTSNTFQAFDHRSSHQDQLDGEDDDAVAVVDTKEESQAGISGQSRV